jgi:hypothetical protein
MKEGIRNKPRERTNRNFERNKDTKEEQTKCTQEGSNKGEMQTNESRGQRERERERETESRDKQL